MVWQPAPVVTGDAVVLDVAIAQLPVRTLAALIDILVIAVAYVIGLVLWSITLSQLDDALSAAILIIFTVLTLVGYPVVMETATRGRSLGKLALGLRVVAEDGGPERFRQALFRGLAGFVEIWMLTGGPAVICSLVSAKGKRLGDIFAGTVVISERAPRLNPPPVMPPALAWWAGSLELSGLGTGAGRVGQAVPDAVGAARSADTPGDGAPRVLRGGLTHLTSAASGRSDRVRAWLPCWQNGTVARWPV